MGHTHGLPRVAYAARPEVGDRYTPPATTGPNRGIRMDSSRSATLTTSRAWAPTYNDRWGLSSPVQGPVKHHRGPPPRGDGSGTNPGARAGQSLDVTRDTMNQYSGGRTRQKGGILE